jgi:hypothetical protein
METLLKSLRHDFPALTFALGDDFSWSPAEQVIYYTLSDKRTARWTLLHEASHGILQHRTFKSDFDLLALELSAWENAKALGKRYGIQIDSEHVEDCLDTYRDWLHKRSLCPNCSLKSLQIDIQTYGCLNCFTRWRVSTNRLCRPYRTLVKAEIPN